ncbi:MAG: hypothetical protein AAGI46_14765 [Planctomycetota bacterium]
MILKEPSTVDDRQRVRRVVTWLFIAFGGLALLLGRDDEYNGLPAEWLRYVFILVGLLALVGVNVWWGGPLDLRRYQSDGDDIAT